MNERGPIALFVQDLAGGGAERVMLNLAIGLDRLGERVDVVMVRKTGVYLARLPGAARVFDLGTGRVWKSIGALARYIDEQRPQAVIAALPNANTAAVLARLRARHRPWVILTEHNHVSANRSRMALPAIRLAYWMMPLTYRWADTLVGVSDGVSESLARAAWVRRARVRTLYNPIVDHAAIEAEAGMDPDHPWLADPEPGVATLLAVGRLTEQKDYPTLLRAVARLRERQAARLVILGEGPQREAIERLRSELGLDDCVALPGFSDRVFAAMHRASLLVLGSRWEGFGNVLVEAMACGTPVVSSDCPSGPSEILENGRHGRLVPPGDADALAEAMAVTLGDPPDAEGLRKRAATFTIERVAEAYRTCINPR